MKRVRVQIQKMMLSVIFVLLSSTVFAQQIGNEPLLMLNTETHLNRIDRIDSDKEGKLILTGSRDRTAKLWDASSGKHLQTFRIPVANEKETINSVALSPDGTVAAIGGYTGEAHLLSIYLYDTETGQMIHRIRNLVNVQFDLEFSPDGRYLAASIVGDFKKIKNSVKIYNTHSWQEIKSLPHLGRVDNIVFDKTGRMATASYGGHVHLYDRNFQLIKKKQISKNSRPFSLSFSPDGSKLAIGYLANAHTVEVLDGKDLSLLYRPDTELDKFNKGNNIGSVVFSADGKYLYAGGSYYYPKYVNDRLRFMVRRWADAGQGSYMDFPAGFNSILDLKSLADGSIIYSSGYPDFGRINQKGEYMFFHKAHKFQFPTQSLRINEFGDKVGFKRYRGDPYSFSVSTKKYIQKKLDQPLPVSETNNIKILKSDKSGSDVKLNDKILDVFTMYDHFISADINDGLIALGGGLTLNLIDETGKLIWKKKVPGAAVSVNISGNGKVVAAALDDGTIRWYRTSDGELLFSLFIHPEKEQWVLWTPSGYYDASDGAEELIGWHVNNGRDQEVNFYPIDRFFETYYRPDIVQEVLKNYETDKEIIKRKGESRIAANFQKPPSVRFTSPPSGTEASSITLTAEITDQGGGIDEVRLFHNGKLIEGGTRGLKLSSGSKTITREFEVSLLPGTNEFELTALSTGQRIESNPATLSIKYQGTVATSDLYVLAVGLNKYKNNSLNLNYGRPDAEAFVSSLKKQSGGIFKSVNVTTLYDEEATRSGVKNAFEDIISKAKPQDAFLFFYAGHGVMSEPEGRQQADFYMALYETTQLYGNNDGLAAHGISAAEMTDLTRRIAARKQMIVLDACQSGGAVETFAMRGAAEQKAIIQLARSAGLVVMASTGTQQYATEFKALGHGVFTYALLNGLQGKADGGSQDGKITVKELEAFINDRVPALTEKHRGQSQYPNSYARGQDFPIGVIK